MCFLIFIITVISGMLSTAWSGAVVDIKLGKFNSLIVIYRVDNKLPIQRYSAVSKVRVGT